MARPRKFSLTALLDSSLTAVFVIDSDRMLRFVSPGMELLTGWKADDLVGLRCERSAPGSNDPLAFVSNALAPPMACLSGEIHTQDAVIPSRKGAAVGLSLTFLPLRQEAAVDLSILVVAEPRSAAASRRSMSRDDTVSRQLYAEINALRLDLRRRFGSDSYIGHSESIRKALRQAELVGQTGSTFLICGPEGSGRRHLAGLIHGRSTKAEASLAVIDCHLLRPADLLGTLHDLRTVAATTNPLPHHRTGMLLLTGVDRLPREVQQWMMKEGRVFEDQFCVGATTSMSPEALNRSQLLLPEIESLVSSVVIRLESLHERGDDILLLAQHFVEESRRDHRTTADSLSEDVRRALRNYRWPGNVRELRTVISAACRQSKLAELRADDLPFSFRVGMDSQRNPIPADAAAISLESLLQRFEVDVITTALASCDGNKAEAARRLGMTRPRFYRRLQALGLESVSDVPQDQHE